MRCLYLKKCHPAIYSTLLLTEKLYPHFAKINAACKNQLDIHRDCHDAPGRCNQGTESHQSDRVGASDKQHPQPSRRNHPAWAVHVIISNVLTARLVSACCEGILLYLSNFQYPLWSEPTRSMKPFSLNIFNLSEMVFQLKDKFSARKVVV